MENTEIKLAQLLPSWEGNYGDNDVKTVTLCVTEACNLACKYCYMTGKNSAKKMTFETAKKCIDYILNDRITFYEKSVVWDFIGGEPFLEIDLIDKICDYIKLQMYLLNHPWLDSYRFSFSSNGLLYKTDKVQKFIEKNKSHLSIGISVDGNKLKHDMQRVYPDGRGSYDDVMENISLWNKQFSNNGTKATFAHDDLPYLKDSIISLWENGISDVAANVVFENVWEDGDDKILEKQLDDLGDHIIENKLWDKYYVRFFDPSIGNELSEDGKKHNFCGSGKMLAIDCEGNFFPCVRFIDFSLSKRKGRSIGNIEKGINENKLRAFKALTLEDQSKNECLQCEVASGCALCTGFNYDDSGSIYKRATYICNLHKATVRANKRFWVKYEQATGNPSPRRNYEVLENKKYMQIMLDDNITPHCNYRNWNKTDNIISKEILNKALGFARDNDLEPVFLGNKKEFMNIMDKNIKINNYIFIEDSKYDYDECQENIIPIYDNDVSNSKQNLENCILIIKKENIPNLSIMINKLIKTTKRINVRLEDIANWDKITLETYDRELEKLIDIIEENYKNENYIEIDILTDRFDLEKVCSCGSGETMYTLAPNGKFYVCPAFYFDNPQESIGDLEEGILNKNENLFKLENSPLCKQCNAYQCNNCSFLNKKTTEEFNIPPKNRCIASHYELMKSKLLQSRLDKEKIFLGNKIEEIEYLDPLEKINNK